MIESSRAIAFRETDRDHGRVVRSAVDVVSPCRPFSFQDCDGYIAVVPFGTDTMQSYHVVSRICVVDAVGVMGRGPGRNEKSHWDLPPNAAGPGVTAVGFASTIVISSSSCLGALQSQAANHTSARGITQPSTLPP
jgi:hypothetical protein